MKDLKGYFNTSTTKDDNSKTPPVSQENTRNSTPNQSLRSTNKNTQKSKKTSNKTRISKKHNVEIDKEQPVEVSEGNISQNSNNIENCQGNSNLYSAETISPRTPTLNAFQLLMNSRNKIIGTNSPGKELPEKEKSPVEDSKAQLKARKKLLQDWSDSKQASKRKLEDEEIDTCIKVKLDIRKKRFKSLLKVESTDDENSKDGCSQVKEFNISSDDFECKTVDKNAKKQKKKKHKHKKKEDENVTLTPSKSWKMKIKLLNDDLNIEKIVSEDNEKCLKTENVENIILLDDSTEINENRRILRNRTTIQKPKHYTDYSDEDSDEQTKKQKVKVAPVFAKSIPRPKEDPEVIEARKKFLFSDIPDVLKRKIEKQESVEVQDFDVFPKISHVQQENSDEFWNLPESLLKMAEIPEHNFEYKNCENLLDHYENEISRYNSSDSLKNVKTIIRNLKLKNPWYPVYKTYRLLKEKHDNGENSTWTEKYKPKTSQDLIGNHQAISTFKNWLETWNEMLANSRKKPSISNSDSESDFQSSDAESCCSLKTVMILTGPCGSGKSSTVYALCNELGFDVIELNASSRRTGKQVLQELQEATQSHHVRKNKDHFKVNAKKSKKMCVLLIEDIDIVFEQDEAFIFAISQISSTTKRPIILTTTDEHSPHSQKFINDFKTIKFRRIPTQTLTIWTQILCLLEGIFVDNSAIFEFSENNNGDIRKIMSELQFWIESGGQINKTKNLLNAIYNEKSNGNVVEVEDDEISLKEYTGKLENYRIHQNIVLDFDNFVNNVPFNVDLRKIWWNFPKFIDSKMKYSRKSRRNREKLKILSRTCDAFAICDVAYSKMCYKCDVQVCRKKWDFSLKDSLKTDETNAEFSSNYDFFFDWNHFLMDKSLEVCKKRFVSQDQRLMDMGIPDFEQQSKLKKDQKYEEELMQAVPFSSHLDRKSVSLDYMSTLRNFARLEHIRAQNNCRRNKRFYNYLQNFNVDCTDSAMLNFAINTFSKN